MTTRTDADQIGAVIEVDTDIVLTPFINAANELTTEVCGAAGYSDTRLAMIETWLAAHFYAQRDPRSASEGVTGVNVSYQSSVQLGFNNTHYGQHALRLDTKGGLAALEKKALKGGGVGKIVWLGESRLEEEADLDQEEEGMF